ncbi:aspartate--tRNA ligase [bacterium]|nr:MAG: aspartate--tRNA ligase [bacterium]
MQRTRTCGELRKEHVGETVHLNGWAHKVRDLGGVLFVDLRDRNGLTQLTFEPSLFPNRNEIRMECCLSVSGVVKPRAAGTENADLPTGEIEIEVTGYSMLGASKPLPFVLSDERHMQSVNEELRVKYRYLDLRRPAMYRRLSVRASLMRRLRAHLDGQGFLEVETPVLTKSTPEGARDFLVPYRLRSGEWYALPQSPQQYKQLLMVAGVERYYQFAKCFRDEPTRADRQPEFMQLDVEMSFVIQEDILTLAENATREALNGVIEEFGLDKEPIGPMERIAYDEAMHLYGCDKPDLRFGLPIFDLTSCVGDSGFGVFKNTIEAGGSVRGIRYPGGAGLSRAEVGKVEDYAKEFGAKGMASLAVVAAADAPDAPFKSASGLAVKGSIAKFFGADELETILAASHAEAGDLLCMIADSYTVTNDVLYRLRLEVGDRCKLRDPRVLKFAWVTDFPLVEWDADNGRWSAMHHPFTMPKEDDLIHLGTDPARIRAQAYDLVCNGYECAGGSIRINDSSVQASMFGLLGIDEETQRERFGHILEAFSFGAPPHGGIAWGFERSVMLLTDTENIREVVPFPKIGEGTDPMMGAPSSIDPQQWAELGLRQAK